VAVTNEDHAETQARTVSVEEAARLLGYPKHEVLSLVSRRRLVSHVDPKTGDLRIDLGSVDQLGQRDRDRSAIRGWFDRAWRWIKMLP